MKRARKHARRKARANAKSTKCMYTCILCVSDRNMYIPVTPLPARFRSARHCGISESAIAAACSQLPLTFMGAENLPSRVGEVLRGACSLAEEGDYAAAIPLFHQAIQLVPQNAEAHEMLAQCLMEEGDHGSALRVASAAVELRPQWHDGMMTYARAARNAGLVKEAVRALLRCQEMGSGEVERQQAVEELQEAQELLRRQLAHDIGIPGLSIAQEFGGAHGPSSVVWDSGLALAAYLASSPHSLALPQRTVLELGAGTGVVGITAASLGSRVTLTDLPHALPLLAQNVAANQHIISRAGGSAQCYELDWGSPHLPPCAQGQHDIIVGADLVYARTAVQLLADTLGTLLERSKGALVLMAHKLRHAEVDQLLLSSWQAIGLRMRPVPDFHRQKDDRIILYQSW